MASGTVPVSDRGDIREHGDAINRVAYRDNGTETAHVIWRANDADYLLDADNASGNHANFGSGKLLVQDAALTAGTHLLFSADATYDVGAAGATRPRDLYLSRNAVVGGTLQVVGVATHNAGLIFNADNNFDIGASNATRPRNIYYGTRIFGVGGEPTQKAPVQAVCTSNLTLTAGVFADVTLASGANLSLTVGRWLITAVLSCACSATLDAGNLASAQIVAGTATCSISNATSLAVAGLAVANEWDTGVQQWPVQVTVAGTIKLQAKKGGGTGSSVVNATHTTLTAIYCGNDV